MKNLPIYLSLLLLLTCAKEDNTSLLDGYEPQISQLNSKITEYSNQVSQLQSTVNSLNNQVNTIPGLENTITSLNEQIGELEETIEELTSEASVIPDLNDEITTLEETIASLNEQIESLELILNPTVISLNSYDNQRSGIVFRWGHYTPDGVESHSTNMGEVKGHFAGGQAYHDVNNDGFQDILVSYHDQNNYSSTNWYLNSGDNKNFNKTYLINSSTAGLSSYKILKTDVNNDNLADFILLGVDESEPGNYGGNFTVLKQTTEGTFDVISIDDGYGLWYHTGAAGDLNNDGFVDVVGATYIWLGDGTGNFTNTNISIHDFGVEPALSYEILDINNDGFNDIVVGTGEPGPDMYGSTSSILLGKSTFGEYNVISLPSTETTDTNDLEFLDYDNDGDLDILELRGIKSGHDEHSTYTFIHLYINNNLTFTLDNDVFSEAIDGGYSLGSYDKNGWSRIKIDDIDNDGVDDIVQENHNDSTYNGLKLIGNVWVRWLFE